LHKVNVDINDNRVLHYLIAIFLSVAMIALRYQLNPWMGGSTPMILLLMAPLISALFGTLPGLLSTVLCLVGGAIFLVEPVSFVYPEELDDQLRMLLFAIIGISISIIGGMRRNAINLANASLKLMGQENSERRRAEAALVTSQQL